MSSRNDPPILWQGFHHVALLTRDLDATIRFYRDVLGMEAGPVLTMGMVTSVRHCFIKPGSGPALGLHFFEHSDAEIPQFPDGLNSFAFIPGAMQHVAFALPGLDQAMVLWERLLAHGVEASEFNSIGSIQNMLFFDNNGILLEATWPMEMPEPRKSVEDEEEDDF